MALRIETARDIAACAASIPLQREVLGESRAVPAQLLLDAARNGGFVALGYVEDDRRPAGMVFGFLGIYDYHFRHHSHLLAVRAGHRGSGLALALKEAQRDHCLDQGIEVVAWDLDPLEPRHARFSFAKLGAYARDYRREVYGSGLRSDRLYVEWPIGAERTYRRLRGEDSAPSLEDAEREGIRYLLRARDGAPDPGDAPQGEGHLLVEIPAANRSDAWREATRGALETAFAHGYAAVELLRSAEGRLAYLLVPQPHRAPEPPSP